MTLEIAVALFVAVAISFAVVLVLLSKRKRKKMLIAGACALGAALLVLAVYIAMTFLFLGAISSEDLPSEGSENTSFTSNSSTYTETSSLSAPSEVPEDFDLPVSEVPEFYPDILGVGDVHYDEMPTFLTVNEVSLYVLHNMLNNCFEMEFYLAKELVPTEGYGFEVLDFAFENALSYFPFSAFSLWDMYTDEERGDSDTVFARIKQIYIGQENDLEACAEALEFVMKNPVPYGGFTDFDSEREYALKIHNFIARKITYSPIGYNLSEVMSSDSYELKQEAFNVLGSEQHDAVCAGYARAFSMICNYAGINTAWVRGNETDDESHAWNIVFPCDGSDPVMVDVTWDDSASGDIIGQDYVSENYFYIPIDEEYEHIIVGHMEEFLINVNK